MGFFSFLGRVLFASLFILSAWQMFNDFGADGGPAAKELAPKLHLTKAHLSSRLGVPLPEIEECRRSARFSGGSVGVVDRKRRWSTGLDREQLRWPYQVLEKMKHDNQYFGFRFGLWPNKTN